MQSKEEYRADLADRFAKSDFGKSINRLYQQQQDEARSGIVAKPLYGDVKQKQDMPDDSFLPYAGDIEDSYDLKEQAYQDQLQGIEREPGNVSNAYLKPLKKTVRGIDIATGKRVLSRGDWDNEAAAGYYTRGAELIRDGGFSMEKGVDANSLRGITYVASGILEEGQSKAEFMKAIDMLGVPQSQANFAWASASATKITKDIETQMASPYDQEELSSLPPDPLPDIDKEELPAQEGWSDAARMVYETDNGQPFQGSDQDLINWYIDEMSNFNWKIAQVPGVNTSSMAAYAFRSVNNGPEYAKALLHLMDTYDRVNTDWSIVGNNVQALLSDPTTYLGFGAGAVGTKAAAQVAKARLKNWVAMSIGGAVTGSMEGAVWAGAQNLGEQTVAVQAGAQEGYSASQAAAVAGVGAAAGAVLGGALPPMIDQAGRIGRRMIQNAKRSTGPGPVFRQLGTIGDIKQAKLQTISSLRNANEIANAGKFKTNRDLKVVLQDLSLRAQEEAGIDLRVETPESNAAVAELLVNDARVAMASNANAIGWYEETVGAALSVLEQIHPEISTDPVSSFAFKYALAVTSNGLKVDTNFPLAESVYRHWKEKGYMPGHVGQGNAAKAINKSLVLYNTLTKKWGVENLEKLMASKFTVRQLEKLGFTISGENKDTMVRGAAILGPKIGNGFYSNLNGRFDELTMDRWYQRTWGRLVGDLLEARPDMVEAKTGELTQAINRMTPDTVQRWKDELGVDLTGSPEEVAKAIQKSSMLPENRDVMNETVDGDDARRIGNSLVKWMDGQKEAPKNGNERSRIRSVMKVALSTLQKENPDLTMADLQALLWYPEKRLYDKAKSAADIADGYADDEAPDYANAAINLAVSLGIDENVAKEAAANGRSAATRRGDGGGGRQQAGSGEFTKGERRKLLRDNIFIQGRPGRAGNAKAKSFKRASKRADRSVSGVAYEYTPSASFQRLMDDSELPTATVWELDTKSTKKSPNVAIDAGKRFFDTITEVKNASPHGASVYVYTPEEYAQMRLFVTPDNSAGFAIKPDGDLVSVFSTGGGKSPSLIQLAIDQGGTKLDAYDTVLPEIYEMMGFKEYKRDKWSDEYMPEDWDKTVFEAFNGGEPDVVYMRYDPNHIPGGDK